MNNNHEDRYGSARFATRREIARAGLRRKGGLRFGFDGNAPLSLDSQGPWLTLAGARSGKLATVLAYNLCLPVQMMGHLLRAIIHDPKGELAAISFWVQIALGRPAYAWNAFHLHDLPCHHVNVLDILTPENPRLMSDIQAVLLNLLPPAGASKEDYFKEQCRGWYEPIIDWTVKREGGVSLPDLYRLTNILKANTDQSDDLLAAMMETGEPDLVAVAEEMHFKRTQAPKEYTATISAMVQALSFMNDLAVRRTLERDADFSLSVICDPHVAPMIYFCVPEDYMERLAPLARLFFTVAKLYKSRTPDSPPVYLCIDEANALKTFPTLLNLFSYGAGLNLRTHAIFQDVGQIERWYGKAGVTSFVANAQLLQVFGCRDPETARMVSTMLGDQTIDADDAVRRESARQQSWRKAFDALNGDDPLRGGIEARMHAMAHQHRNKQRRALMSIDEILRMPAGKQVCFVSDLNLHPLYIDRHQYWMRREMAGRYYPNPYQPNFDRVVVRTLFGRKALPVVTEKVPEHLAPWPQHKNGYWKRIVR